MKSFSQFLQESYLSEEEAVQGRILNRKNQAYKDINNPNPGNRGYATDPTPTPASRRLSAATPETPKEVPGQQVIRQSSTPSSRPALPPSPKGDQLATRGTNPQAPPESLMRGAYDAANKPPATPKPSAPTPSSTVKPPAPAGLSSSSSTSSRFKAALEKQRKAAAGTGPSGRTIVTPAPAAPTPTPTPTPEPTPSQGKLPSGSKFKVPAGLKRVGRVGAKLLGPAAAALDVADERSKGSGWLRSGLKAAVVGGAGALGAAAGAPLTPVGSLAAGTAASVAASKAFDVAAGANAVERKAMATANRQKQAGTAIKGIGGQTTFSQKKPGGPAFMSTGSGSQRKTVQLAKTGVVQRGGQSVAGNLAFKDGKAVYKAGPSAQSLAKTSSNPLERIGRSLFAGAYKKSDAANAAKKLATARQNDAARNKALGVKALPGK